MTVDNFVVNRTLEQMIEGLMADSWISLISLLNFPSKEFFMCGGKKITKQ